LEFCAGLGFYEKETIIAADGSLALNIIAAWGIPRMSRVWLLIALVVWAANLWFFWHSILTDILGISLSVWGPFVIFSVFGLLLAVSYPLVRGIVAIIQYHYYYE
jgi:hypothetical protein